MKKSKLHLSKETICRIENEVMSRFMGGDDTDYCGNWESGWKHCEMDTDQYTDCESYETKNCSIVCGTGGECHVWSENHPCIGTVDECGGDDSDAACGWGGEGSDGSC